MAGLAARIWNRTKLLLSLTAVGAFLFLLPARFTAPARVLFNEAVGPAETAVYQGTGEILATTGTLTEMFLSEDRGRGLAREVRRLRNANVHLAEELMRRELRLRSMEKLELRRFPFRAVRAPVASYDTSAARRSVTVRAGRIQGVQPGLAAASDGALVGIVMEAGPLQCRVRLLTDPESVVPCRLSATRKLCILVGAAEPTFRVEWVDRDAFIESGDVLVTTSLKVEPAPGLALPDGLPAGTVKEVRPDPMHPLFYRVEAAPRVNLERLEEVEILVPEPEDRPTAQHQHD